MYKIAVIPSHLAARVRGPWLELVECAPVQMSPVQMGTVQMGTVQMGTDGTPTTKRPDVFGGVPAWSPPIM